MLRDLGSRDNEFIDVIKFVHNELMAIAGIVACFFFCFKLKKVDLMARTKFLSKKN